VTKLRGKKAIVQVGAVPITVDSAELIVVKDKSPVMPEESVDSKK
jgi:hypothetical protein